MATKKLCDGCRIRNMTFCNHKNRMTKKNTKFQQLRAWCGGKAYNFPTDFHISKSRNGYYYLDIYTGSVYLAKFILSNKKELYKAVDIVTKSLKHNTIK